MTVVDPERLLYCWFYSQPNASSGDLARSFHRSDWRYRFKTASWVGSRVGQREQSTGKTRQRS